MNETKARPVMKGDRRYLMMDSKFGMIYSSDATWFDPLSGQAAKELVVEADAIEPGRVEVGEIVPASDMDRVRALVGKLIHNCDCTQLRVGDRSCDCEVPELRTLLGIEVNDEGQ